MPERDEEKMSESDKGNSQGHFDNNIYLSLKTP